MSIIERALDKLDEHFPGKGGAPDAAETEGQTDAPLEGTGEALGLAGGAALAADPRPVTVVAEDALATGEQSAAGGRERSREIAINLQEMALTGLLTPDRPQSQLSEEMRQIKRPLLGKLEGGEDDKGTPYQNLIMVTSSLPGEGKTFTSINLAVSIAMELDRTVLLVDTDAAKSDVVRRLGIEAATGLTDYLTRDDISLPDILLRTNIPKLTILPAGTHHDHMTELLASGGMKKLVDDLSTRYHDRVVVFDSPPVLVTSGAAVLASLVGQIVFVVRAEKTLASDVKDSLKQLRRRDNVGIVLNRSREWGTSKSQYGSYYYYYGRD